MSRWQPSRKTLGTSESRRAFAPPRQSRRAKPGRRGRWTAALAPTALLATLTACSLNSGDVAQRLDPSVVRVFTIGPQGMSSGTGLVLNRDGYVATNFHVIQARLDMSWRIVIADRDAGKKGERAARLVEVFRGEDLAILHVEGLKRQPVTFTHATVEGPTQGSEIFAIGFPGASDRLGPVDKASFTRGTISRVFKAPWAADAPEIEIIQHTAPTNPGNSGGPLVDRCGRVVGINSQREVRMVLGPGGVPLVTDPIQGVFYASDATVLTDKLRSLNIKFAVSNEACSVGGLLDKQVYLIAIAGLALFAVGFGFVRRPQPLVRIVVNCGEFIGACADAVERAVRRVRSSHGDDIEITAGRLRRGGKSHSRATADKSSGENEQT